MNETDTPTNISNNPDHELEERTNSAARRLAVGGAGVAAGLAIGSVAAVGIGQEAQRQHLADVQIQNGQEALELRNDITDIATSEVDPLDIQANFTLGEGELLYDKAHSIAVDLPAYQEDPKANDETLLKSAQDLGVYHEGEDFVIAEKEYAGEDRLFVQRVTDAYESFAQANDIQFYDPSDEQREAFNNEAANDDESTFTIPTPKTH